MKVQVLLPGAALLVLVAGAAYLGLGSESEAVTPAEETPAMSTPANLEKATLGGGCFWCLEAVFAELEGVHSVVSGYAGGSKPDPTYQEVCTGTTGHAEVVQLSFDPARISYQEILTVFFHVHDPTTLNRQGHDVGSQYRSVILYHSPEQKRLAEETIARLEAEKLWPDPIVTRVEPFTVFYPAESYHQDYYARNPSKPYCSLVIAPKMAKFRQEFRGKLKTSTPR